MEIFVLGTNYKKAPVDIREKLVFSDDVIKKIYQSENINELVFLSTCNRVEFYGVSQNPELAMDDILRSISSISGIPVRELRKFTYRKVGREAIKHVFEVISSLDSMVLGENQIVKQVKDAFTKGEKLGTVGQILKRLKDKAIQVSKKVRTSTGISQKAVSISYVAVELAKKIFDTLEDKTVLLIGAGEMAELAARHLVAKRVKHIFISNRTFEKAIKLANEFGGSTIRFEKVKEFLSEVDIVIVSTGAKKPILYKEDFKKALKVRKGKPIFVIDISVPRNVSEDVNELDNVYLYNIDDLKEISERNQESRKLASERAKLIIEEDVLKFESWLKQQKASPIIAELYDFANSIVNYHLEKLFKQLPHLTEEDKKHIELSMKAVVRKLLHRPVTYLKNRVAQENGEEFIREFENMFLKQNDGLAVFNKLKREMKLKEEENEN